MTKKEAILAANSQARHWKGLHDLGNSIMIKEFHVVKFADGFDVVADRFFETYGEKKSYYKISCV